MLAATATTAGLLLFKVLSEQNLLVRYEWGHETRAAFAKGHTITMKGYFGLFRGQRSGGG